MHALSAVHWVECMSKVITLVYFLVLSFIVCHVALLGVLKHFVKTPLPPPPLNPILLPMDIFLKIPTDWISYPKPFLK